MRIFVILCLNFLLTSCSTLAVQDHDVAAQAAIASRTIALLAPPVDPSAIHSVLHLDPRELECMALNIYFEARGEGDVGMAAVGYVVANRMASSDFPSTACGVIKEAKWSDGKLVLNKCQFSWYCDGLSDIPKDKVSYAKALKVAERVLLGAVRNPVASSMFYHNNTVSPNKWFKTLQPNVALGAHQFYSSV